MANKLANLAGTTHGYIKVNEASPHRAPSGAVLWDCTCTKCGRTLLIATGNVRRTNSCLSCAQNLASTKSIVHGHAGKKKSATYRVWSSMRERCLSPAHPAYKNYGGRGIVVCDAWQSFEKFLADMGEKPLGYSLDRIDNDKGYSRDNCRWASRKEQDRNKRSNVLVTAYGITQPLVAWAEKTGVPAQTIAYRVRHGWKPERAVSEPTAKSRLA